MDEQFVKYLIAGVVSSLIAVVIFEKFKAKKSPCGCRENGSGQTTSNYRPGKYPTPAKAMAFTSAKKGAA